MTKFRTVTSSLATVALIAALAPGAYAGSITISGNPDYRAGSGGEFNITAADGGGAALLSALSGGYTTVNGTAVGTADGTRMNAGFGGTIGFQTFCVEYNEFINLGGTYTATISDGAIYGGVGGGIDPDGSGPLPQTDLVSVGTAYLYSQFAQGTLVGYTYTNGAARAASAVMLQEAIWYLEDEIGLTAGQIDANTFLQAAFAAYGEGAKDNSGGLYGVRVLNLGGVAPDQKQDQLIMVPDGGLTLTLLGLGLSGLSLMRRKSA
jgi:hypothetical protein